jgi:hypothetical protein
MKRIGEEGRSEREFFHFSEIVGMANRSGEYRWVYHDGRNEYQANTKSE